MHFLLLLTRLINLLSGEQCVPFKYGLCVSKKHDLSKGQCLVQELSAQLTEFVYSVSGEQ